MLLSTGVSSGIPSFIEDATDGVLGRLLACPGLSSGLALLWIVSGGVETPFFFCLLSLTWRLAEMVVQTTASNKISDNLFNQQTIYFKPSEKHLWEITNTQ